MMTNEELGAPKVKSIYHTGNQRLQQVMDVLGIVGVGSAGPLFARTALYASTQWMPGQSKG